MENELIIFEGVGYSLSSRSAIGTCTGCCFRFNSAYCVNILSIQQYHCLHQWDKIKINEILKQL